jgi:hypothetical protein
MSLYSRTQRKLKSGRLIEQGAIIEPTIE